MNSSVVSTRNLATRVNAGRVAQEIFDRDEQDMVVVETGDPAQPFVVEIWVGQANAVELVSSNLDTIKEFLALRARITNHAGQ